MTHSPDTANIKHDRSSRLLTNGFANAQDEAHELISGVRDHDKAHGLYRHNLSHGEVAQ